MKKKPMSDRQRIVELFQTGRVLYFSDIAEELGIDLKRAVSICKRLMREKKVYIHADV